MLLSVADFALTHLEYYPNVPTDVQDGFIKKIKYENYTQWAKRHGITVQTVVKEKKERGSSKKKKKSNNNKYTNIIFDETDEYRWKKDLENESLIPPKNFQTLRRPSQIFPILQHIGLLPKEINEHFQKS